ncbi:putative guanine nucleotide binding protein (G-protein), alpha subunit [Lupinus albus]|uniref:Putative guanine nucleotide binding protein (G-protein), alpha subunit n=1 Tax=Lupinus albus TaxID=3870 RepID=A0A6A4NFP9_LUPAL|nr:putative guanine nucleotide binding protein (G-protein), alpha subunit [Lupinus albus]
MASESTEEDTSWKDMLRSMLPAGAPLPDEDHLDYSIAVEYAGPPLNYDVPRVHPLEIATGTGAGSVRTPSVASSASNFSTGPIHRRFSRFSRVRNGGFSRESRSPVESQRPCSVSRTRLESRSGEVDRSDVSGELSAGFSDSAATLPNSAPLRSDGEVEGKRPITVAFHTPKDSEDDNDGCLSPQSVATEPEGSLFVSARSENTLKKRRVCSRCGNGNRLKEKEACLVCDSRYCSNCVLKAMGSMPEGRKCVSCIGMPIYESKRSTLGKCSRMLSRVCSPLEIKQIMRAEKECAANQLRPEQLIVNGRQLRQEELAETLACSIPPSKLKPGRYWYDKDSGFWGKEGEKPDKIISSKLNIGGKLQTEASNGNTGVYMNGREITKVELRVLKLANVQCSRDTHFWVYDDGSYEEEGQNNIKGNIWGKASTRLICSLFSLPVPPNNPSGVEENATHYSTRSAVPEYLEHGRVQKLLLFGMEGSGTATLFKQARLSVPFMSFCVLPSVWLFLDHYILISSFLDNGL